MSFIREIEDTLVHIRTFAAKIHSGAIQGSRGPFRNYLLIGIGGSALGPQFLGIALGSKVNDKPAPYFFDNTNPDGFLRVLATLRGKLAQTLVVEPQVTSGDYLHGFYLGTRQALAENGRESISITIQTVSPFSVWLLIALFERTVGLYWSLVNVNAYHQPGVEGGKKAANAVLDLQKRIFTYLCTAKEPAMTAGKTPTESQYQMG